MKVAVVTDVVDDKFYFPTWHDYYQRNFGAANIFVCTYTNSTFDRTKFGLAGVIEIPSAYNEQIRAKFISEFCSALLQCYDYIIRVDIDEFLIPDPRIFRSLSEYFDTLKSPYVTAVGLDIIQAESEPTIDMSKSLLLKQRRFAYPNSSLNKTCITSVVTLWTEGFHFCSFFPKFNQIYLLHLKRADIEQQISWSASMSGRALEDASITDYYSPDREAILRYRKDVFGRQLFQGWSGILRDSFLIKFFLSITPEKTSEGGVIYSGSHFHDDILIEIPEDFSGLL